jgi:hypothetical protein
MIRATGLVTPVVLWMIVIYYNDADADEDKKEE